MVIRNVAIGGLLSFARTPDTDGRSPSRDAEEG
jgi:hypothetical protein